MNVIMDALVVFSCSKEHQGRAVNEELEAVFSSLDCLCES